MKAKLPVHRLKKAELVWLATHYCEHGHTFLEHYGCYVPDERERIGFLDIETSNLDADFGIILCVAPETKVLTADLRWVRADSLQVGDKLIGVNEYPDKNRRGEKRRLLGTSVVGTETIVQPRVKITTTETDITVSSRHRFLVYSPHSGGYIWKEAANLKAGDKIRFCATPWPDDSSREAGWLAGIADGEGCLYSNGRRGHVRLSIVQSQKQGFDVVIEDQLRNRGYHFNMHLNTAKKVRTFFVSGGQALRFLGQERPLRLLGKFAEALANERFGLPQTPTYATVAAVEPLDEGPVVTIETSTHTLITNGLVSHNSYCILDGDSKHIYEGVLTKEDIDRATAGNEDRRVVKSLIEDLGNFDRIVTYYGKRFDVPYIRTRALATKVPFPDYGSLIHTDLYFVVKHRFKLSSSRLVNACKVLLGHTDKTRIEAKFWRAAARGDEKSLRYVLDHNRKDVLDLEKLYRKVIRFARRQDVSI